MAAGIQAVGAPDNPIRSWLERWREPACPGPDEIPLTPAPLWQALRLGEQKALTARAAKRLETALSAGTVWMKPTATHSLRVIRHPGRE